MVEINSGTIYNTNYCTNYTGNDCLQWTTIYSFEKSELKEFGVSILWNSFVFVMVLFVLGRLVRILFGKFFGGRR